MIYLKLFWSFLQVGLLSIGGGYAAIPLIQSQVVDLNGWLSMGEFTNLITIAEMTPGPISINSATFVGIRIAGIAGAAVATFGCILPACFLVSLFAYIYRRFSGAPAVSGVLNSLRPAVVALIAAAGLSMLKTAFFGEAAMAPETFRWVSAVLFVGAFLVLRTRKWNPILVMCLCGAANLLLYLVSGGALPGLAI